MEATGNREQATGRPYIGPAIVVAMAVVAVVPMMVWGESCGHDYAFHVISWMDCLSSWKHGIVYPHWAPTPDFGAGEPRFVFYPPLTWMLAALLGRFLPVTTVEPMVVFLMLAGTGLATRALAREALEDAPATLAGCLAICSGYALFTGYERAAYAELAGGIWIPLLLLFVLREARPPHYDAQPHAGAPAFLRPGWEAVPARGVAWLVGGSTLPVALIIAAVWLSNAPLGVMACYLLAAMAMLASLLVRSWTPLLRGAAGAALGLGLAAFYLVPAAHEQRWVDVRQATDDPGLLVQNSWLFARHPAAQLESHDIELAKVSVIAVSMIGLALLSALVCWVRRRLPGVRNWWLTLLVIPPVVLLLQFAISWPVWHWLPKLRFLQFPWRWLVAVEAPLGVFVAAAFTFRPNRGRVLLQVAAGLVLAATAMSAGFLFHQDCDQDDSVWTLRFAQVTGSGVVGYDEYAPPGADDSMVAVGLPGACLVSDPAVRLGSSESDLQPAWTPGQKSCQATAQWEKARGLNAEHKALHMTAQRAGYLVLKLRRYPAWRVTVNGGPAQVLDMREDGLMAIAIPKGNLEVRADWATTPDVIAGRSISVVSVLLVTVAGVLRRRSRVHAQLK